MPDPTERLNAALEGRYSIERELGEGGMVLVHQIRESLERIEGYLSRLSVFIALVLAWGCASSPAEAPPSYTNPLSCAETVASHLTSLDTRPDQPPVPRNLMLPPASVGSGREIVVTFVVSQVGAVLPGSIEVSGLSGLQRFADSESVILAASKWTFHPARSNGCWVPAKFSYQMIN